MKNFLLWVMERFPPINFVAAGFTYFATALCLRKFYGLPTDIMWYDYAGWMVLSMHLLVLRVIDEHKDYDWDKANHPNRVLQRGLVTLPLLKKVGIVAFGLSIVLTAVHGMKWPIVMVGFLAVYGWTYLMTKEFFVGEKLRQYVFLYSFTHLLISPFLVFWSTIWAIGEFPRLEFLFPMMGCSFFVGLSYEIARKTKGKEEEVKSEPSYSNTYTLKVPVVLMTVMALGMLYSLHIMSQLLGYTHTSWIPVVGALMLLMFALSAAYYLKHQNKKGRKYNEGSLTLMGVFVFITAIVMGW